MWRCIITAVLLTNAYIATATAIDEDFIDTEVEVDEEAALKCDACKIVAKRFGDAFALAQINSNQHHLNEEEVIEATETACNDLWEGYGVKMVDGVMRLDGPDAVEAVKTAPGTSEVDNPLWVRRFEDLCDELLAESQDELTLYNLWLTDSNDLQTYLCQGDDTFGACASNDWGPWPGDDYDDYEDDDMEYIHDEF